MDWSVFGYCVVHYPRWSVQLYAFCGPKAINRTVRDIGKRALFGTVSGTRWPDSSKAQICSNFACLFSKGGHIFQSLNIILWLVHAQESVCAAWLCSHKSRDLSMNSMATNRLFPDLDGRGADETRRQRGAGEQKGGLKKKITLQYYECFANKLYTCTLYSGWIL